MTRRERKARSRLEKLVERGAITRGRKRAALKVMRYQTVRVEK